MLRQRLSSAFCSTSLKHNYFDESKRKNMPECTVSNHDINQVFRYSYLKPTKVNFKKPKGMPEPPGVGDIKVILQGFPWYVLKDVDVRSLVLISPHSQAYSDLNKFKRSTDHKSSLMLTGMSEIELRRPDYVVVENVPGFMTFAPGAKQVDQYRVEGGLKMGGLKLLIRVLTELG